MHKPSRVEVAGPLAAYAIGFRRELAGRGYSRSRATGLLWLGHESVQSTQVYLHADLALKEQALARTTPPGTTPGRYRPPDTLLAFLEAL